MRLNEIAIVRSGLVLARKKAKDEKIGETYRYPLINFGCMQRGGWIDRNKVDIFDSKEQLNEEYLTKENDIVIRLTEPYTAALIEKDTTGIVISSNFVVIRVLDNKINIEYLHWLLNTERTRWKIYQNTTSNMLGAINANYFSQLDLEDIPIHIQDKIGKVYSLSQREGRLLNRLIEEKEKLYSGILNDLYKTAKKGV